MCPPKKNRQTPGQNPPRRHEATPRAATKLTAQKYEKQKERASPHGAKPCPQWPQGTPQKPPTHRIEAHSELELALESALVCVAFKALHVHSQLCMCNYSCFHSFLVCANLKRRGNVRDFLIKFILRDFAVQALAKQKQLRNYREKQ